MSEVASQAPVGVCANHPTREGRWFGENTFLCTECKAKEIVVLGATTYHTDTQRPLVNDPLRPMRQVIGKLVHGHLDHLWYASPDALPDDPTDEQREDHLGCCPECCGPCSALFELAQAGYLDRWVQFWPDTLSGSSWWDADNQRVDRVWLTRAWGQTETLNCHS